MSDGFPSTDVKDEDGEDGKGEGEEGEQAEGGEEGVGEEGEEAGGGDDEDKESEEEQDGEYGQLKCFKQNIRKVLNSCNLTPKISVCWVALSVFVQIEGRNQ